MNWEHQILPENRGRIGGIIDFFLNIVTHPDTSNIIWSKADKPKVRVIDSNFHTVNILNAGGRTCFTCGGNSGFIFQICFCTSTLCYNSLKQSVEYRCGFFRYNSNLCGIFFQDNVSFHICNLGIGIWFYIFTTGYKNLVTACKLFQCHTSSHTTKCHCRKAGCIQFMQGADLEFILQSIIANLRSQNIDNLCWNGVDRLLDRILNCHWLMSIAV